jgi:DNA-binding MarR family transcriptional regulator
MVKPSGLSHRLNRLESAGLVTRTPDADDRRSFLISITPAGRQVIDRAVDILVTAKNSMLGALDERQRQSLHSMLDALVERIDS